MTEKTTGKSDYKKSFGFKLEIIVFAFILVYLIFYIIQNFKTEPISGYQVKNGMLSENRIYSGIAIREEVPVYSEKSGYINFFVNEGERAAFNNLVYCIDESGRISNLVGKSPIDSNSLNEAELRSLKQEIQLFSKNFTEENFLDAPVFEDRINNELRKIQNRRIIDDLSLIEGSNDIIDYYKMNASGIVLYYIDGYEEKTGQELTPQDFNQDKYNKTVILNDDLIEAQSFIYKYINNENWSIVINVPNSEVERIVSNDYVEVKFSKTLNSSFAKVQLLNTFENESLIELSFTNSMISFCKDRYIDIELLLEEDTGLKVPNSSIAEKAFYLIDKDFVTRGNNSSAFTVLKKEYGENGETVKNITIDIVKEDETEYYVDTFSLNYGDILIKPGASVTSDNENTFVVGKQGTLIGVYNINKGYADFNRIEILYSNDEYSIIKPNSSYGLRAYDYIALDASTVTDKDFVY